MADGLYVSYLRVSTIEQGRSGLGIEAQRASVARFLNGGNWSLIAEYVEYESGGKTDRPKLEEALQQCKLTGAKLVVARLDRLSRNTAFTTALMESKTPFVCCDMPDANECTITIMAALAQQERKRISENTKAALAAREEREPYKCNIKNNATAEGQKKGAAKSAEVRAKSAEAKRLLLIDRVRGMKEEGLSLRSIAEALTAQHIQPPRAGGSWSATAVYRILDKG